MVSVEEITVPGCVDCVRFEKFWDSVKDQFPGVTFTKFDATTPEGMEKVSKYSIFASPGVIINGELFSTGGVRKNAFLKKLKELGADKK